MRRPLIGLSACILVAACATPASLVLLPNEKDGGAVAVLESGGIAQETIVSEVNSRTDLGIARPKTRPIDPTKLTPQEKSLLANLPPAPVRFILYFTEGTTKLVPESAPLLSDLQSEIRNRTGPEVQVTGYTDTVGTSADNDVLSQRRAEEILNVLADQGIDKSLMNAVGRGERSLRVPTADNVDEPRNRRVEVIVR